jgi:hypothetical protein
MIETLQKLIPEIFASINRDDEWDSLIVNRRKPWTYRVFRKFGDFRVCLHAFDPCSTEESFAHPHPWPGAFLMLKGSYIHNVGFSQDLQSEPVFHFREIVRPYSMYEIVDRRTWHTVQPLERTYTIMVNGEPWENAHANVRTTKGKDLDKMQPNELREHLSEFLVLLNDYMMTRPEYVMSTDGTGGTFIQGRFISNERSWSLTTPNHS